MALHGLRGAGSAHFVNRAPLSASLRRRYDERRRVGCSA